MKKSILFVLHRIGIGGSMASMLNLLELLKKQNYEVDLFLMEHEGQFLHRAKNSANLLKEDKVLSSVKCNKKNLIESKDLVGIFIRIVYVLVHKLIGVNSTNKLIYQWRANKLSNKYDNVIAYQESMTTEFVQYIAAENKIAWVHTNFEQFAGNKRAEDLQQVYDRFDKIVCVSKASKSSMIRNLMYLEEKIYTIYNPLNNNYILEKSNEYIFNTSKNIFNFVSIGRFVEAKKFERIIEVSCKLLYAGFQFRWYIVGNGDQYNDIEQMIKAQFLDDTVILLGVQSNPYPIIKAADCVVITSLYEAQPMVANEGLILHKPVISTRFASVYEVIDDKNNGLICDNSCDGIYNAIKEFMDNITLRDAIKLGANKFYYNNDGIIEQVSKLLI